MLDTRLLLSSAKSPPSTRLAAFSLTLPNVGFLLPTVNNSLTLRLGGLFSLPCVCREDPKRVGEDIPLGTIEGVGLRAGTGRLPVRLGGERRVGVAIREGGGRDVWTEGFCRCAGVVGGCEQGLEDVETFCIKERPVDCLLARRSMMENRRSLFWSLEPSTGVKLVRSGDGVLGWLDGLL